MGLIRGTLRHGREHFFPATFRLVKVQSMQSPLAVAFGYEKEQRNGYWSGSDGKLYERVGNDFIHTPTRSLAELIQDLKEKTP